MTKEILSMPKTWLINGGAGFIGSHLVKELLRLGQRVRVLDNFSSGRRENLAGLEETIQLIHAAIRDRAAVRQVMSAVH